MILLNMLTRVFMNNEYLILPVLFSLCYLSSPGSLILFMFFGGRARVWDWYRSVMFLMNHILPFPWTWFFLSESIIRKEPNCDLSVHMKQNSTEWGTICCSCYISKIHIDKAVEKNHHAVQCDHCQLWVHIRCNKFNLLWMILNQKCFLANTMSQMK